MTSCSRVECGSPATHGIKICVPGVGLALAQHKPIELTMALPLCAIHARDAQAESFFADRPTLLGIAHPPPANPLKPIFEHAAGARGIEPDFDRAYVASIPLDSVEWKEFEMNTKHGSPRGSA